MSSPLPLRLCCMAAMAPALTEAATQARIRLPSSPTVSLTNTSVSGRECISLTPTRSIRSQGSGFKGDVSLGPKGFITLPTTCHQNGGLTFKSPFTQLSSKAKVNLTSLGVISSLPDLCNENEFLKFTKNNGNCRHKNILNTMNQPNSSKDDKVPSIQCEDCGSENEAPTTDKEKSSSSVNTTQRSNGLLGSADHQSSLSKLKLLRSVRNDCEKTSQICSLPTQQGALRDNDCTGCESQPVANNGDNLVQAVVDSGRNTAQDCEKTQIHLERRVEYLKRRLRRLQSKQIQVHTHQQLNSYVTYQNGNLKVLSKSEQTVTPERVKTDMWQAEDVKNLSTVALVSLVKKIQTSQNLGLKPHPIVHKFEPLTVLHQDIDTCAQSDKTVCEITSYIQHVEGAFDSDATASSSGGESADESVHLHEKERKNRLAFTSLHRRPEWKWAVDRAGIASRWTWLQAQVSDLEYRIRQQSDIYRQIRANKGTVVLGEPPAPEDLMAKSRLAARPGKRLSPLEAKIANIEKKNEMSPCNISTLLCNVDKQSSKLAQSLGNCLSPSPVNSPVSNNSKLKGTTHPRSINGFLDSRNSDGSDLDSPDSSVNRTPDPLRLKDPHDLTVSPAVDASCQAARCRPVKSYRKRKLLRTVGTHTSRKAIRLCSVKCQCYPPVTACAMCGGRYNSTRKINPHTMHTQEKISLLDTSTHPILSFPQDTPLPIHLEGIISSDEWQAKLSPKAKLIDRRRSKMPQLNEHSRKTKRYARGVGLLTSTKYRRKLETISRPRNRSASLPTTPRKRVDGRKCRTAAKRRRAAQLAIALKRPYRSQSMSVMSSRASSGSGSRTPTPSPQAKNGVLNNSMSVTFREMKEASLRKKRVENAYDIDNIVIPYSMAASTRVTKLKYKEIVTPKWRDLLDPETEDIAMDTSTVLDDPEHQPDETGDGPTPEAITSVTEDGEEDEIEDCSDEAFMQRHMKCEGQEKKRFMSFIQYGRRVRGSRTESGSNTPEQLSADVVPLDSQLSVGAVLVSDHPPTPSETPTTPSSKFFTPIPVRESRESKDNGMRRRSGSLSRRDRSGSFDDSASQGGNVEMDIVYADPWQLRSFPLEQDEYETILAEQPSVEELKKRVVEETAKTLMAAPLSTGVIISSRSSSPAPSTSTSMSEEDPNDPEWTLHCNNQQGHPSVSS